MNSAEKSSPGLRVALRRLMATGVGIFHTRIALAGLELEEEIQRLVKALLLALGLMTLVGLALLLFTLTIVFAFAGEHRFAAMSGMVVLYLAVALLLGLKLKTLFAQRPPIFEATLGEFERDREALRDVAGDLELHAARGKT